jgi:hypothetical protein
MDNLHIMQNSQTREARTMFFRISRHFSLTNQKMFVRSFCVFLTRMMSSLFFFAFKTWAGGRGEDFRFAHAQNVLSQYYGTVIKRYNKLMSCYSYLSLDLSFISSKAIVP